jgi:hypothetical protein
MCERVNLLAQQKLTYRYKYATENLRIAALPDFQLVLSRVINRKSTQLDEVKVERDETSEKSRKVSVSSPPKTPRSIAEQAFLSPTSSGKSLEKKNESPQPFDCMNHFHSLCISGSTTLDMFRM